LLRAAGLLRSLCAGSLRDGQDHCYNQSRFDPHGRSFSFVIVNDFISNLPGNHTLNMLCVRIFLDLLISLNVDDRVILPAGSIAALITGQP